MCVVVKDNLIKQQWKNNPVEFVHGGGYIHYMKVPDRPLTPKQKKDFTRAARVREMYAHCGATF